MRLRVARVEFNEVVVSVEGEFRWWKLSGGQVLLKVDGVSIRLIGEVGDGLISHKIKSPRLIPIILRAVQVQQVFFSFSFDGRSPIAAINGNLVSSVVNLYLEVLQDRSSQEKRCVTWDHEHLQATKHATYIDR